MITYEKCLKNKRLVVKICCMQAKLVVCKMSWKYKIVFESQMSMTQFSVACAMYYTPKVSFSWWREVITFWQQLLKDQASRAGRYDDDSHGMHRDASLSSSEKWGTLFEMFSSDVRCLERAPLESSPVCSFFPLQASLVLRRRYYSGAPTLFLESGSTHRLLIFFVLFSSYCLLQCSQKRTTSGFSTLGWLLCWRSESLCCVGHNNLTSDIKNYFYFSIRTPNPE